MSESGVLTTSDGCTVAWRCDGPAEAPPLVLSNSLGSTMAMWTDQVAELSRTFRLIRYDQRGHGASGVPGAAVSLYRLGLDVLELLDLLGVERAHFCGVSLGGMVGQWLGAQAPARFNRMIFCCTSPYMGPPESWQERIDLVLTQGMGELADSIVARWVTPAFVAANPDRFAALRAMIAATDARGYAACCAAIRDMDLRPTAPRISRPVLVISGNDDPATPPAIGQTLAARIPGARSVVLPGAHLANIESALQFNALITQFILESS